MKHLPLNHLFIPSRNASSKLMIILHGRGDSLHGFTWLPQHFGFDDMNYLLLDAPYAWYGGRSWYDLPPHQAEGISRSSQLLAQTLDTLFEKDFDPSQSFLFGFSQGALLTFEFGARYRRVLGGYIAVSGYIYNPKSLLQEIDPLVKEASFSQDIWLCTHGTEDEVLPYETTKAQIELLQKGGMKIDFKSYPKPHTIIEEELKMIREWIAIRKT